MSKRQRWRPRRLNTLLVGFACMLALITAMGFQVQPFTYLWVSLYTGLAVAVLAISLTVQLEKKYREEHEAALEAKLTPVVCVGESLAQRESHLTHSILKRQFEGGLDALTEHEFSRILLAYEPVWAIGTGKTATPEMAADAHRYLRELAATVFSPAQASGIRILYGGSVKPDNIKGLMAQTEIDGALVGGASLDAKSFAAIVNF